MTVTKPGSRGSERGNTYLRAADRYLGIPLLATAGLLRRRRSPRRPDDIRRIGMMNGGAIGDTVLLSPVAADIAAAYSRAEVIIFTTPTLEPLTRVLPNVTSVLLPVTDPRAAISTIRAARTDVFLDFHPWPRIGAVYALTSGAAFTAGFRTGGQYRHYAYDAVVEHSSVIHELENIRRLAAVLGVESTSAPQLSPAGAQLPGGQLPTSYVVFHLWPTGVGAEQKEWPAGRWRALVKGVIGAGHSVVLTGGPADSGRSDAFARSCGIGDGRLVDTAGHYNLGELVDVLSSSDCVVSVNTGVAHIAAATGVPTLTLNGPTSARRWGPIGERATSIDSTLDGCGFLNLGWEFAGRRSDCMEGISTEAVLEAVLDALKQ